MVKNYRRMPVAKLLAVAVCFLAPLSGDAQMMIRALPGSDPQVRDPNILPYLSDPSNGRDSLTASADNARPDAPAVDTHAVAPGVGVPRPAEDELIASSTAGSCGGCPPHAARRAGRGF